MKISEIRNQYRFSSAEEMAEYNADYKEQYEADLAAKKEDLLEYVKLGVKYKKSLAAANADRKTDKEEKAKSITAYKEYAKYVSLIPEDKLPKKAADWKNFDENIITLALFKDNAEFEEFAKELLNNRAFSTNANHFGSLAEFNETLPAEWAFFSYEEILAMEADGATIPKEVLAWAHAMEDCNVSGYALDENSIEEIDLNSALNDPDKLEQQVQVLSKQTEDKQKAMDEKAEKLKETAKKAEQVQKAQEESKGGFLKEINDLTEEYAVLSQKVEKGEELSTSEQERLKTLGKLLNGKDGKVTKDVQASSNELQALIDTMDGLTIDINDSKDLGGKTLDLAKELAKQEKSHGKKNISKGFGVAISTVSDMSIAAQGGEVANIANKNASGLIEFANTLSSQLMMNQYASLYEFAEIFTADADKALGETKDAMGENFDKSSEELGEETKEPELSAAEQMRKDMAESGASLPKQAAAFSKMSMKEGFNALKETVNTSAIKAASKQEGVTSEIIGKFVEVIMKPKKEEYDELEAKEEEKKAEQEKEAAKKQAESEAQKAKLEAMGIDPEAVTTVEKADDGAETKEQARMNKLSEQMEAVGTKSQERLYQSLTKIEGFEEFLADKEDIGLSAIDVGTVTQLVGADLVKNMGFVIPFLMLGMATMTTGAAAEVSGKGLEKVTTDALTSTAADEAKVQTAQTKVEQTTMVAAISNAQPEENAESEEVETVDETKAEDETQVNQKQQSEEVAQDIPESAQVLTTYEVPENAEETQETAEAGETVEEAKKEKKDDDKVTLEDGKQKIKEGNKTKDQVNDTSSQGKQITSEAKADAKESEKTEADAKKDIKKFEQQGKIIQKEIQQDSKKIENLSKDSIQAVKEQEMLAAEYDALTAQNELATARIKAKQNAPAAPVVAPRDEEQGGLLAPAQPAQPDQSGAVAGDIAIVDSNNARIGEISGKFQALDARITKNRVSITKLHAKTSKRIKQFKAVQKQKVKLQKELQKKEKAKQERLQKKLAIIGIFENVLQIATSVVGIISFVADILGWVGTAMLSNPFTAIAGAALVTTSEIMSGICKTINGYLNFASSIVLYAKIGVLFSEGQAKQATMILGQAMIQIAMNVVSAVIPGGGSAVSEGMNKAMSVGQAISSTANLVTASANMANNISILNGNGPNKNAQAVAQIAGVVGGLASLAGGFQGFGSKAGYQQAAQILQTVGQAATSTAQMSTIIKQAQGKDPGKFEAIMGLIGTAASTVGAMTNAIGGAAASSSARKSTSQKDYETKLQAYNDAKAQGLPVGEPPKFEMRPLTSTQKLNISQNVFKSVGSTATTIGQFSSAIKQMNGQKSGKFEAAMMGIGSASSLVGESIGTFGNAKNQTPAEKAQLAQGIFQTVGKAASVTAQITAMAKQANGEKTGEFEAIMGLVGNALVTTGGMIGSIAGFVDMAKQAKAAKEAEEALKNAQAEAANNGAVAATPGTDDVALGDPEAEDKLAAKTEEVKETDKEQTLKEKREARKQAEAEAEANLTPEERLAKRQEERTNNLKTTKKILEVAQAGWNPAVEAAFSIAESSKTDSNSKAQNSDAVLKLSNLEKGRALVKKIKRRREVLSSHVRSQKRSA